MKAIQFLVDMLKRKNITQTELADRMDLDRRQINNKIRNNADLRVSDFDEMLKSLGSKLVVEELGFHRVSKGYFEWMGVKMLSTARVYYFEDGSYTAFDCEKNGEKKTFETFEEMEDWFRKK